jgi:WD40 repeat protein/serine/threonine protein kinase
MVAPSPCPPAERLRQLLIEAPVEDESAELVAHVGACAACQRALDELAGADPALLRAACALHRTEFLEEPCLERVLHDLESDANLTRPHLGPDRTAWLQSLLRPAASAEALGRLEGYEVTGLLGQGGMGLVLKAFDRPLKRWVAIKVLTPELAGDRVARQRFEREGQAAAAVRHEHVVTIHAVREANGLPYLVMEYVAGGSLQDYLDEHGPPDWRAATRLGAEVARGLAAAHARGLVHRDIKPSNVLLQTDGAAGNPGVAKIGDFGLARVADESRLTRTGVAPGTPMYMSPEQALCGPLDGRSDLFSLGSLLYTLCTGREPFPAGSPVAVLRQVCEATPRPVRELNPAVPAWLAATVERLHAKRPADRFASAAEVAELLRHNLEHPDRPRPVAPPPRRTRHRARRRILLAAVAGLLLAGGLLLGEAFHRTRGTGEEPSEAETGGVTPRATLRGHDGPVWSVAFAPDGQTLATAGDDSMVRFWDPATGREKLAPLEHRSPVVAVAFAHSGKFLLSGDSTGAFRLWDFPSRAEKPLGLRPGGNGRRVAIAPDDRTVAVGGAQGVELWDLDGRALRRTLSDHQGTIWAVAFAPDGKTLATGDTSGSVRLWDPATGEERLHFRGDSLGVRALAFALDGRFLASGGSGDRDVKLWDVTDWKRTATLSGHDSGVSNVAIAPGGRLLAAGSRDGIVKLWDLAAPGLLATLHAHQGGALAVAFAPDGRTLATAGEDRLAKLWDLGDLADPRP